MPDIKPFPTSLSKHYMDMSPEDQKIVREWWIRYVVNKQRLAREEERRRGLDGPD